MDYEHEQRGRLPRYVAGVLVFIGVVSIPSIYRDSPSAALVLVGAMVVVLATVVVYNRLTIRVTATAVTAAFGWGWPKRVIEFHEIAAIRRVRNPWIYGWGSRWIPGGWMYNVWGRSAVELVLASGSKFRIGTDDPGGLIEALPQPLVVEE